MADRDRDMARSQGGSGSTSFGTVYSLGLWNYEPNPVPEDDRDLRRYINDELQKVRNVFDTLRGEAWHYIDGTGEPAFVNSWANRGTGNLPDAAFYLDPLGIVRLKGTIDTGTSGTVAFTLPEGYRPPDDMYFVALASGGASGYILIDTSGNVTPTTAGAEIHLNNITFSV